MTSEGGGSEKQQAKARGFLHAMKDGAVIKFACFLYDLLSQLSSLSLTMQRSSVTVSEIHDGLSSTRAIILKYKTRYIHQINSFASTYNVPTSL